MARLHRFNLPDPFWSLELLELDERSDGETVRRLFLVDPESPGGLQLIRTRQLRPLMLHPAEETEVIE